MRIDLNADVGEGYEDESLFPWLTSVNVACGGHAGDESSMRRTVRAAVRAGLAVGAHPSYPDRERFGRVDLSIDPPALEGSLIGQIEGLRRIAGAEGVALTHVKPHGTLYNRAARDRGVAEIIVRAVSSIDSGLVVVGLAGSGLPAAARAGGLRAAAEAFADRRYAVDGSLVPRGTAGAVIDDPEVAAAQALSIVRQGRLRALDGADVAISADTLCIHSDTPGAAGVAVAVHRRLLDAGVELKAL